MNLLKKSAAGLFALCLSVVCIAPNSAGFQDASAAADVSKSMTWDAVKIGGAGFVSGIVTGQKEMYLRTDVGGAYKWNYETSEWEQLMAFINDADKGMLSVKGIAIDPTDDNTVYFLCGCAYFSDARTAVYKTTDGGKTFTSVDVTEHIQVHGNGDGRECIEPIAIDPDNPDVIYAGGDVTAGKSALIKSTDGGKTWNPVMGYDELGLFTGEIKYPMWTNNMVRGTEPSKEYNQQNGIGCILIEDGKVYVGTSVTGQANIHVADVKDDKFTELSADLPTANYPCSITNDGHGNIFFTYIAGLAFAGASGGAYKYDTKTGKVTCFDELTNAIGMMKPTRTTPTGFSQEPAASGLISGSKKNGLTALSPGATTSSAQPTAAKLGRISLPVRATLSMTKTARTRNSFRSLSIPTATTGFTARLATGVQVSSSTLATPTESS